MAEQLFPRIPKRKKQPSSDQLRLQLALAADELIRLRIALERERTCPYWRRLLGLGPDPFYVVWKEPMP